MEAAEVSLRERAMRRGIRLDALPRHLAIIMDGNGRWATERGRPRLEGHAEGYATLQNVVFQCGELGVPWLTVYAFSAENWRRPGDEVAGLMELIETAMLEQIPRLVENRVRVRLIGRLAELPDSLRRALDRGVRETAHCDGLTFTLAVNYGGRAEIVDACRSLARDGIAAEAIDECAVAARLYDPEAPETDLMVRTAGEMRWSNFLLWQSAYAELVVTDTPWPAFDGDELLAAVAEFQRRTRKFGGLSDTAS